MTRPKVIFATTVFDEAATGPGVYARYLWGGLRDDDELEFHVVAPSFAECHARLHAVGGTGREVYGRVAAKARQLAAAQAVPLEIADVKPPTPPDPTGMSYEEYGRALNVPGLDPTVEDLQALHLWHVLDNAEILRRLLSAGVSTWGQLHALIESGGEPLWRDFPGLPVHAAAAARAIENACRAWRVGRAKPVDRRALEDSGGVTASFIDRLSDLAKCCGGDAQALLDALAGGEVSHWRSTNTESLREYLEDEGYLPDTAPLSPDDIRARTLTAVAPDVAEGRIHEDLLNRILGAVAAYSQRAEAPSGPVGTD